MTGSVRHLFPGGNTGRGFYSYYDYLAPQNPTRIFVVKGGPGVGKSSFMKRIGESLLGRGYSIEHHHCSSDPDCLDGMTVPEVGIALLDGTAPHVVDPKYPGAIDEIIHLGDYWNESALVRHRSEIVSMNDEIGRLFRRAYGYLHTALHYQMEYASYYQDLGAVHAGALNEVAVRLEESLLPDANYSARPYTRRLFASALTPDGEISHVGSLLSNCSTVVALRASVGAGAEKVMEHLSQAIIRRGLSSEHFYCPLKPDRLEHIIVPSLGLGITTSREPHKFAGAATITEDLNLLVDTKPLALYRSDMELLQRESRRAVEAGVHFVFRAKKLHDELETLYVPNMDFAGVDERRAQTLKRILDMI